MSELDVRIVELAPMRVASAHGFGFSPEDVAWKKLISWAGARGLLEDLDTHRIFGFNNPNPSPGSPNYGYEFWIVVGPEVEMAGEIKVKSFPGGRYAVTRCDDLAKIGEVWKQLVAWRENSTYRSASHQWLEEHVGPIEPVGDKLELDLYLPIAG